MADHPLLVYYRQLIEAAEMVINYKCECAYPDRCCGCIYGPLRQTLKQIMNENKRTAGDGRG
jgi:hypothetical protein